MSNSTDLSLTITYSHSPPEHQPPAPLLLVHILPVYMLLTCNSLSKDLAPTMSPVKRSMKRYYTFLNIKKEVEIYFPIALFQKKNSANQPPPPLTPIF